MSTSKEFKLDGCKQTWKLSCSLYPNGALAVQVVNAENESELAAVASVNIVERSTQLPAGVFFGKHYSENEGLLEQLVAHGVIEPCPSVKPHQGGFVLFKAYKLT